MTPAVEVKPGQTWRDRDKRMNGRTVRVERIEYAAVSKVGEWTSKKAYAVCRDAGGKYTRLSVERMERQKFWILVRDENGIRIEREVTF